MGFITLDALIAQTRAALEPLGHSPSTRWQYDYAWRQFHHYGSAQGLTVFSPELAERYVQEIRYQYEHGALKPWKFKLFRKAAVLLVECYETGGVRWTYLPKWGQLQLTVPAFAAALTQYGHQLSHAAYGRGTQGLYAGVAKQFLQYLEQTDIRAWDVVTLGDVSEFIPYAATFYQPTSMRTVLSAVRHFLRFTAAAGLTAVDLSGAVPKSFGRKTAIVPTLTMAEERQLLAAIDRTTAVGRRDFAIVLLALRLGLRSVDIANLQLTDIQWRTQTLTLVQQKTGRRLETPLLADVGNAIIDYLLHGRPTSASPQVFLRSQAPFVPLSGRHGVYHVVRAAMNRAGIRQDPGQRKGPHSLRHSLAARLLAVETPLPVISGVLGHADKDTTKIYLATDTNHLRACALGLDGIELAGEGWQ